MTRLHWAMSMPSSATEVAIRMLLSPLALNASSTHFCAGSVIPVLDKEDTVQLTHKQAINYEPFKNAKLIFTKKAQVPLFSLTYEGGQLFIVPFDR